MKALKTFIIVLVALCSFASADAQIRVRIGGHPHRYYRHHYYRHHFYHHPYRRY